MSQYFITQLDQEGIGEAIRTLPDGKIQNIKVPFSYPGETVEGELFKKDRRRELKNLKIINESPNRAQPLCKHFSICGGCLTQQIPYNEQLVIKQKKIEKLFEKFSAPISPIVPSPSPWHYRNKMEFSFSMDKKGEKYLGLIGYGMKGRVVNLEECPISQEWFMPFLKKVKSWWDSSELLAFNLRNGLGTLRTLTLRAGLFTGSKMAVLTVSGNPDYALTNSQLVLFKECFASHPEISLYLRIHQAIKGQPTQFFDMHLSGPDALQEMLTIGNPIQFNLSPSAFFQPNPAQAVNLFTKVGELLAVPQGKTVYDLYCGTGTLALSLASQGINVIGIELSADASLDARENAKLNGIENIEILTGDVAQVLKQNKREHPYAVVVDPPRSGLSPEAIEQIVNLKPEKICYIACSPLSQARDLEIFVQKGYIVKSIHPFDQFPQTPHIENISLLSLSQND